MPSPECRPYRCELWVGPDGGGPCIFGHGIERSPCESGSTQAETQQPRCQERQADAQLQRDGRGPTASVVEAPQKLLQIVSFPVPNEPQPRTGMRVMTRQDSFFQPHEFYSSQNGLQRQELFAPNS